MVLAPAATVADYVVAVHVIAVIVAFGVLFVYPLLSAIGVRSEPRAMSWFHRLQWAIHMRLQAPALAVVALAGIYLASDLHDWSHFFVAWGLAAVIVIGAIGGAYISPREKRLAELAEREATVAPVGGERFAFSDEYRAVARQADLARLVQLAITVATIFFMALHL
jgi:hypothetical protein